MIGVKNKTPFVYNGKGYWYVDPTDRDKAISNFKVGFMEQKQDFISPLDRVWNWPDGNPAFKNRITQTLNQIEVQNEAQVKNMEALAYAEQVRYQALLAFKLAEAGGLPAPNINVVAQGNTPPVANTQQQAPQPQTTQQKATNQAHSTAPKKDNTMLYIGVGLGLVTIAAIAVVALK